MGAGSVSILVVEDEPAIQELIAIHLKKSGYNVLRAIDAEAAQRLLHESLPDLIMVDWMLPGLSGIALLRFLRAAKKTRDLPIIMMTARSAEQDIVFALECGADDYITKPFNVREMVARVDAVLRRKAPHTASRTIGLAGLRIDPDANRVTAGEREIVLSPTEFRLLHFMMSHPQRIHSRAQLLDKVWGLNEYLQERTVDAHVGRLRNALEATGHHVSIETVRGIGYRFIDPHSPGKS